MPKHSNRFMHATAIMLAALFFAIASLNARADDIQPPSTVTASVGRIVHLDHFPSQYVAPHNVDVWLPPGYPKQAPYAVLYMFDGQNLFGDHTASGGATWRADATAAKLIAAHKTRPFIIVGIWNAESLRMSEYFPQKPWEAMTPDQRRGQMSRHLGKFQILPVTPYSDAFLKFMTQELKPAIDQRFKVDAKPDATFVMGSSMGGLMAWYAMAEYPDVFGGAACLSTHWLGNYLSLDANSNDPAPDAFVDYIRQHFPSPAHHKVYFDHGTRTLDAWYGPIQKRVDAELKAQGWGGTHFESLVFPGADHSERSWSARLATPMKFLLAPSH